MFTCKECGKPAAVVDGKPVRSCKCEGAILAHLRAHAGGAGGVK